MIGWWFQKEVNDTEVMLQRACDSAGWLTFLEEDGKSRNAAT